MAQLPANVTIPQLPAATTLTLAEVIEAVQTSGGVGNSVQVALSQIMTTGFGGLPAGGGTGQIIEKASGTDFASQWANISSLVTASTGLAQSGSTTVALSLASTAGLSVLGVAAAASAVPAALPGTAAQVLRVNDAGNALAFGALNLGSAAALSGLLGVPFGGTHTSTLTQYGALYGNGSSALGVTAAGTSGYLLTGNGTVLPPSFQAFSLGSSLGSTIVGVVNGGTNTSTLTANGVVFGNGSSTVGITNAGNTALVLISPGPLVTPIFGQVSLTAAVTGVLSVPNGGSGTSALTANSVLIGSGAGAIQFAGVSAAGNVLVDQGSGSNPAFRTVSGDLTLSGNGTATIGASVITYGKIASTAQGLGFNRLAKAATYTVANSDKGLNLALGGNAFFGVTATTASTYDSNFSISITNEDSWASGRAKYIQLAGSSSFLIWPQQTFVVWNSNNVWRTHKTNRAKLPVANVTFWVDPTTPGSDTYGLADGLTGSTGGSSAFASVGGALWIIYNEFDWNSTSSSSQVTVSLVSGATDSGVIHIPNHGVVGASGSRAVTIDGNNGTFSGGIQSYFGTIVQLQNANIATTGITATQNGVIYLQGGINFGAIAGGGAHMFVSQGGLITLNNGTYTVSGGAGFHVQALSGGNVVAAVTMTAVVANNLTFGSDVAFVQAAMVDFNQVNWSTGGHTVNGTAYNIQFNGVMLGASNLPHTVAGGTTTGGQFT